MVAATSPNISALIAPLTDQAVLYLTQGIGLEALPSHASGSGCEGGFASALEIGGAFHGSVFLAAGEGTASAIMVRILGGDVAAEERPMMLQDTLCEVLNMIVGNTTQRLDEAGMRITVSTPSPVDSASLDSLQHHHQTISTDSGPIVLAYKELT